MDMPRIGAGLPSCGPSASPDGIRTVAIAAERLGLDSLWTFERLLLPAPAEGESPYPLPESNASVYDPLDTLTWVAAHTERIRLGTSVLDALFHPPVAFARDWRPSTDFPPAGSSPASGRAGCPRSSP
jgi:alkanesulfonate monooxygenase SsuD/methylene tetrahydromethanopterin reductase-like flavin-dependent oxidoreductase (luciferase family)